MSEIDERLKGAVRGVPAPNFLEARIRASLRATDTPRRLWWKLVPTTGAVATLAVLVTAYHLGHLRLTVGSQESYIGSVSTQVATLMRVGLRDHIHCSVFRKYPQTPPTAEEFVKKMDPQYAGLIPIVRSQVPTEYRMTLAHKCRYHGRLFVHLSLMDDSNMLSLVITKKTEGESFKTEDMLPALVQSDIPMYHSAVQRFQTVAFETRDYLVYFISDLPQQRNTEMMVALAPQVNDFLKRQEF